MSYASDKGYRAEALVRSYLATLAPGCYRPRAGGPRDVGDIGGVPFVVSVKDHAALSLSAWVDDMRRMTEVAHLDVGVVWHKRRNRGSPALWYVTTTGDMALVLLRAYATSVGGGM